MTKVPGWLRLSLAAMLCAGATACAVGPDFKPPPPPEDKGYLPDALLARTVSADVLGGEAQRFVSGLDIPQDWWSVYRSKPLDDLVARSIRANPDIKAALAALRIAQQNARAQRAALFPTVSVGATGMQSQAPLVLSAPTADGNYIFGLFTAFLNVSYVLDVFGGVRRQGESMQAQAEQQCFLLEAAYLSLASNVVVAAITEASLRAQLDATRQSIELQKRTLGLLDRQLALGQAALADVATQRAALAQTEAGLPGLEKQLAQQRHLLASLAGQTTANLPGETFELASLQLPTDLPVSLPSRMVEQRPDIRAAEANLHAASAAIGVAIAAQLPQFNIGTSVSGQSLALDTLFSPDLGLTSAVGGGVLQTLLDGGALQARTRAARAAYDQAQAQYRSTVLQSFRNVADTLRALELDAVALRVAVDAEKAAALSLQIARGRLAAGDAGVLMVLTAELTHQQAVLARVQAQANRLADTAALYQALGGGWWNREAGGAPARRAECKPPAERQGSGR
ncbi:MAG: efflux transporter outer membrane subunit [Proteobacteria bacterium]|nr:efflux transporter outer membrane subunit [Pseudomonadota bacterium]